MVHTYLGETIHFHITYKKKKSVRLFVDSYGNVEVQAPKGTPVEYLVQLLEEKWDWIQTTRKEMAERARGPQEKDYDQGEGFLYLGIRIQYRFPKMQVLSKTMQFLKGISYIFM